MVEILSNQLDRQVRIIRTCFLMHSFSDKRESVIYAKSEICIVNIKATALICCGFSDSRLSLD